MGITGGIESVGGFLAINEMLLQSHDGVLRLFPCWPRSLDAAFGTLRARGAFLVSARLRQGEISHVSLQSEKGRSCTIANPWPGRTVSVVRDGRRAEEATGEQLLVATAPGETLELSVVG